MILAILQDSILSLAVSYLQFNRPLSFYFQLL